MGVWWLIEARMSSNSKSFTIALRNESVTQFDYRPVLVNHIHIFVDKINQTKPCEPELVKYG